MATIAVVDDHPAVLALYVRVLEQAGHDTLAFEDATQLLLQMEEKDVDALILDLFMPPPDGLEVLGALRKVHPDIPVVAISGGPADYPDHTAASTYLRIASHLGAVEVLSKPIEPSTLLDAVNGALADKA